METLKNQIETIKNNIGARKCRSYWEKGVVNYAFELLERIEELAKWYEEKGGEKPEISRKFMMNGADSWEQYSYGGCSLVYDEDIASNLCTPSELKKNKNGLRNPNSRENWLDVQARALHQAEKIIMNEYRKLI